MDNGGHLKVCKYCGTAGLRWTQNDDGGWFLAEKDGTNHTEACKARHRARGGYPATSSDVRGSIQYGTRGDSRTTQRQSAVQAPRGPFSPEYVPGEGKDMGASGAAPAAAVEAVPRSGDNRVEVALLSDTDLATLIRRCTTEIATRLQRRKNV